MAFTITDASLRDREYAKFYGGVGAGSTVTIMVQLIGSNVSGTYQIACDNDGYLLVSGIN